MKATRKLWTGMLVWAALCGTLGCAEGSRSEPEKQFGPPTEVVGPTCGNGKPDATEQCDCAPVNGNAPPTCKVENMNMTCVSMGAASGQLLCTNCRFDMTMCVGGTVSGSGGGGIGR